MHDKWSWSIFYDTQKVTKHYKDPHSTWIVWSKGCCSLNLSFVWWVASWWHNDVTLHFKLFICNDQATHQLIDRKVDHTKLLSSEGGRLTGVRALVPLKVRWVGINHRVQHGRSSTLECSRHNPAEGFSERNGCTDAAGGFLKEIAVDSSNGIVGEFPTSDCWGFIRRICWNIPRYIVVGFPGSNRWR